MSKNLVLFADAEVGIEITKYLVENFIEDISQSYGSISDNKKAGSFGNAAIGSLSPAKIISSIGGGFILIDDKLLIRELNFSFLDIIIK